MTERSKRTLTEIAYDPKPGDAVRVEYPTASRTFRVRDVQYSDVLCDVEGEGDEHVSVAHWYAMCLNSTQDARSVEVIEPS